MICSEFYSAYCHTVTKIIETAIQTGITEKELEQHIAAYAFSESAQTILPALKTRRWPFLKGNLSPALHHVPTKPLTLLEKRWLKAICQDPKIKLFDVAFPDLEDVEPLFRKEDYSVYDRNTEGDPYEDEAYREHFKLLLTAIKQKRSVSITLSAHGNETVSVRLIPEGLLYAEKEDRFRIIAEGHQADRIALRHIVSCTYCDDLEDAAKQTNPQQELTLQITNVGNALERVMQRFAYLEKQAERLDDTHYILKLKYHEIEQEEILQNVLSFGTDIKVIAPKSFIDLIKARLRAQKDCELG